MIFLGLPFSIVIFVAGSAGLYVLLDTKVTSQLAQGIVGDYTRMLVQKNPFLPALFFNGGLIAVIFSIVKIVEYFKQPKKSEEADDKKND